MFSLIQLIQNEQMKTFRRIGTWIMIALLLIVLVGMGIIMKTQLGSSEYELSWQQQLQGENESIQDIISSGHLPSEIQRNYESSYALNQYRLENDIPPNHLASFWGFLDASSNLISLITLFTIIIAAGKVASEFSWGTIKLLLIRPVSRSKILLSKYLSTLLFSLLCLIILYAGSFVTGFILFGAEDIAHPNLAYIDGEVVERSMPLYIASLYGLSAVSLVMMSTFAFMISSVFRSSSLAIGLAIFLVFTGPQVTMIFHDKAWVKYLLFSHLDLAKYITGFGVNDGSSLSFSIAILTIYFIVFNLLSWWIFNKRDVSI